MLYVKGNKLKKRRVEFLQYFNDYPMLAIFTMDVVGVFVGTFAFVWLVLSIGGSKLVITMFTAFGLSFLIGYLYKKAKEETSKGFLKHWAFNAGIYRLLGKKWEELEHADNKDYLPTPQDLFFAD